MDNHPLLNLIRIAVGTQTEWNNRLSEEAVCGALQNEKEAVMPITPS